MKRLIHALALGALFSAGCTDARSSFTIEGVLAPQDGCVFKPDTSALFVSQGVYYPRVQALALGGGLSQLVGFQLLNNVASTQTQDVLGNSLDSEARDAIQVDAADIDITDLSGNTVAHETVVTGAYVPGQGGLGVAIPDIMGKPLEDLILQYMAFPNVPVGETLILKVTMKGHLTSGQGIQTEPFNFPIALRFDYDPFATQVGDAVQTVAVLVDGGYADEVIQSDGTAVLGDAAEAGDGTATVTQQFSRVYAGAIFDLLNGASSSDGGSSDSGDGGSTLVGVSDCN